MFIHLKIKYCYCAFRLPGGTAVLIVFVGYAYATKGRNMEHLFVQLNMADQGELRMNVAALKRVDPYITNILDTATHVALYSFSSEENEWEKTDVEGALFVYSRSGEPYHGFLIMNRLNTKNLVEPVTEGLDLQLQQPFLLYRNSKGRIYGIWFYDKTECIRIASALDKLVKESELSKSVMEKSFVKNNNVTNVDIFTMLSKAQEDFNSNKNVSKSVLNLSSEPESKLQMPQGVMDFFAKASSGATQFVADKVTAPTNMFVAHQSPRVSGVDLASEGSNSQLKPLLQRLMSNPAHSVEHIEKQQRSITPQEHITILKRTKSGVQSVKEPTNANSIEGLKMKMRPLSSGSLSEHISRSAAANAKTSEKSGVEVAKPLPETALSVLRIASPLCTVNGPLAPFFASGLQSSVAVPPSVMGDASSDQRPVSAPLCTALETPQKPALMPPTMFTSSAAKNVAKMVTPLNTPKTELCTPGYLVNTDNNLVRVQPEPLTKNQFLQAFTYLIKNDTEFVNKLHEAYVKSFADMVL